MGDVSGLSLAARSRHSQELKIICSATAHDRSGGKQKSHHSQCLSLRSERLELLYLPGAIIVSNPVLDEKENYYYHYYMVFHFGFSVASAGSSTLSATA